MSDDWGICVSLHTTKQLISSCLHGMEGKPEVPKNRLVRSDLKWSLPMNSLNIHVPPGQKRLVFPACYSLWINGTILVMGRLYSVYAPFDVRAVTALTFPSVPG